MKNIKFLAIVLTLAIVFTGCSSSEMSFDSNGGYKGYDSAAYYPESPSEMGWFEGFDEVAPAESEPVTDTSVSNSGPADIQSGNRKLIRTFDMHVETLEFEKFVGEIKNLVNSLGGYIENSSLSGNSYSYSSDRDASFTCRIPSQKLYEFVNEVGDLGNVTYSYEDAQDITLTYVDTEARITSLQTEYDRLLELLAEAESIDTIILLEQRISDVRYQLESYKSQLRTYDNLVDYSTVTLHVNEVKRVTSPEKETVWERISSDFSDNLYSVWTWLQDFFVWFIASLPVFALLIVIALIIFVIVKLCLNLFPSYRAKKAAKKAAKAYKKQQALKEKKEKKEEAKPEENKE